MLGAACGDSTGPNSFLGVYTLETINGLPLPVTVLEDPTGRFEITGGQVTLNGNGTFSDRTDLRVTSGLEVLEFSDPVVGTYVRNGDRITFDAGIDGSYEMTLSGRTLTQFEPGLTFVYRR
jgi:hypothetical protein